MSSVHKQGNKPCWFCAFYDPEGFRRFRSTGSESRRVATTICTAIERASLLARNGKLSNEKALKLVRDTGGAIEENHGKIVADRAQSVLKAQVEEFVRVAGGELVSYSIRSWLDGWLAGRTDASKATLQVYRTIVDYFLTHLGARADRPLTTLQQAQIDDFKTKMVAKVSPSTVNRAVKVLKAAFSAAVAQRQLEFSPAQHVKAVDEEERGRRPFTDDELGKLITATAEPKHAQWRTMIVLAFYTGLRLRDCANLTWESVDLHKSTIHMVTQKTGRTMVLPIAEPLAKHLGTLAGDAPAAPLCPALKGRKPSALSNQFYQVMVKAGIAEKRDHEGKGKGRDGRRDTSRFSFHSLRYNTTSALKNAGVSESVAMDIVGHETEAVSRNYTKIAFDTKKEAVAKLKDITK
jgi:integrase